MQYNKNKWRKKNNIEGLHQEGWKIHVECDPLELRMFIHH